MMEEISLHILDIAMNAVTAGADTLAIRVCEDTVKDRLEINIADNGKGMGADQVHAVLQQFATEKTDKRRPIALGLALLRQSAEACGGEMRILSAPGKGTQIEAWMQLSNIDRPPLGKLEDTIFTICAGAPVVNVVFHHEKDGMMKHFESAQLQSALGPEETLQSPNGLRALKRALSTAEQSVMQNAEDNSAQRSFKGSLQE
ncbi:MAG TPA: ATP-binding protein [Armatimonadota bacterium]|nr:ATP-binding protein [Armatimonadota bacterium]